MAKNKVVVPEAQSAMDKLMIEYANLNLHIILQYVLLGMQCLVCTSWYVLLGMYSFLRLRSMG